MECLEILLCTRIVYERAFLLQLRNSPISRTPPKDLANFPGRMLKGVDIQKDDIISSPSKPGILLLPHGNAYVERGFSQTSNCPTDNRTCLYETPIRGMQSTKGGFKHYNHQCNTASFMKNVIKKGHGDHKLHLVGLEEEKIIESERKKQEQENKKTKVKTIKHIGKFWKLNCRVLKRPCKKRTCWKSKN
uniref:Uncharacterized protein n=1 Tax=Timema shepardi TaxID=629360 RepID=A0A7R9B7A6_TIMSH|nr:unnamed protein product [Timema shepardi]